MAHLGAIWADLVGRANAGRCDTILRQQLSAADYARYVGADARTVLHREVRAAELAGYDPEELLARAVRLRPLDDTGGRGGADDVARVLHSRVRELAGSGTPRALTYAERTPWTGDPDIHRYLHELAGLMDQRTIDLGQRAAANPPAWALAHLGPVPDDPLQRDEWAAHAGTVAAYRERYGRTDPREAIGREPAAPEARADWHAALAALGIPREQAAITAASTGELWARRARYERELAWAPPHVGTDLRATAHARREHATQATLTRARARTADRRLRAEQRARAQAHQQLADSLERREAILSDIDNQRERWHNTTAQARASAQEATEELRRRFPDADLRPFHEHVREGAQATEEAQPGTLQRAVTAVQPERTGVELRRAADLAHEARCRLDERRAQVHRDAQLKRQRQADEASPDRWPHRDPGYDLAAMQRRLAERTAAQLAAQDFRAAVPDLAAARRWAEPLHEQPGRRPRQAEREEPEATL